MAREPNKQSRGEAWAEFRRRLARQFPDHVDDIQIQLNLGVATIYGEVASEAAKAWLAEQVQKLPGVEQIRNLLVVAAPLTPASSWDPFDEFPMALEHDYSIENKYHVDEGTDIVRYPSIELEGATDPGSFVVLNIDLRLQADDQTAAAPMKIADLDLHWERVDVEVEVHSASLSFDHGPNKGVIVVRRNEPSLQCSIRATINANLAGDHFEVMAVFTHGARHSGIARRIIPVKRSANLNKTPIIGARLPSSATITPSKNDQINSATLGWTAIGFGSEAPTLTCRILRSAEGDEQRYVWSSTTTARVGPGNRTHHLNLGDEASGFAKSLRMEAIELRPGDHSIALRGFGQQIWDKTPAEFQSLYWALRREVGQNFPIQIITDEPYVPWELMQPYDEESGDEANHLFLDHPVTRWVANAEGYLWRQLPKGTIASFTPEYEASEYELPFAADEAAWLCAELGAIACETNRTNFLGLLQNGWSHGTVATLHFAGHGTFDGPVANGILLTDGWITSTEVGQTGNRLGVDHRSLAVINACDVGATAQSLGTISGWAAALAKRRFSGFIAPLWPVTDRHASEVVRTTLGSLYRDNLTLGEAMRKGRQVGCHQSPTPYAYVCYGDVMARVT